MHFLLKTPSRLHFSLIDLNGSLGRIDGGFGLALQDPSVQMEFSDEGSQELFIEGATESQRVLITEVLQKFVRVYETSFPCLHIIVHKAIPEHFGLGSKTQFLLAIAKGLHLLKNISIDIDNLARFVQRGGTSGIGYMAFKTGKFIVDLGHSFGDTAQKSSFLPSSASSAPPALPFLQLSFPEDWLVLLLAFDVPPGANNTKEVNIFQSECPVDQQEVAQIVHHLIYQVIPGILEHDLVPIADAMKFINTNGFKKIEISLQHDIVQQTLMYFSTNYKYPSGMSSFGPTIFMLLPETDRDLISGQITQYLDSLPNIPKYSLKFTTANNTGINLKTLNY